MRDVNGNIPGFTPPLFAGVQGATPVKRLPPRKGYVHTSEERVYGAGITALNLTFLL